MQYKLDHPSQNELHNNIQRDTNQVETIWSDGNIGEKLLVTKCHWVSLCYPYFIYIYWFSSGFPTIYTEKLAKSGDIVK